MIGPAGFILPPPPIAPAIPPVLAGVAEGLLFGGVGLLIGALSSPPKGDYIPPVIAPAVPFVSLELPADRGMLITWTLTDNGYAAVSCDGASGGSRPASSVTRTDAVFASRIVWTLGGGQGSLHSRVWRASRFVWIPGHRFLRIAEGWSGLRAVWRKLFRRQKDRGV